MPSPRIANSEAARFLRCTPELQKLTPAILISKAPRQKTVLRPNPGRMMLKNVSAANTSAKAVTALPATLTGALMPETDIEPMPIA